MIAQLTGTVASAQLNSLVLDVGGVGYLVHSTPRALAGWREGEQATAFTSLVVREDSMTLFGFDTQRDRETFEILVSVQGIGPRLALAILAVHAPETIAVAAANEDTKAFTQVPGIGPKGAQRIVLELKGKLQPTGEQQPAAAPAASAQDARSAQVLEALMGLGWSEKDASKAIAAALADDPFLEQASVPVLLRAVLAGIGRASGLKAGR
ncbi:MAG: Holliday junction branch migration protein RuvA [Arthrobacter sp.]|jgi:Holliday junction DNA helicase RuvA|nr:Holliday junction branch migration protein RuvA [Arthrobacter sp.]